jgi:hypothetical protein
VRLQRPRNGVHSPIKTNGLRSLNDANGASLPIRRVVSHRLQSPDSGHSSPSFATSRMDDRMGRTQTFALAFCMRFACDGVMKILDLCSVGAPRVTASAIHEAWLFSPYRPHEEKASRYA